MIWLMGDSFILLDMLRHFFQTSSTEIETDACTWGEVHRAPANASLAGTRTWIGLLLLSALWQVNAHLIHLMGSDSSESVHQARIGWRRFRSSYRLFQLIGKLKPLPLNGALSAVMFLLSELRDIDVARLEVLPELRRAHRLNSKDLLASLNACIDELGKVADQYRCAIRCMLNDPSFAESMWRLTLQLVPILSSRMPLNDSLKGSKDFSGWAEKRVCVLHQKFLASQSKGHAEFQNHRTRICAKRLRYAIEDLECVLQPGTGHWLNQARQAQSRLGLERDSVMTAMLAEKCGYAKLATLLRRPLHKP